MQQGKVLVDQMGRQIALPRFPPQRIVSLVPSQTELLYDLGLSDRLVGLTKFCVHPEHLRKQKTIVGGTKQFRFDVIDELNPDLIIGNKEENYKEGIEQLAEKYPVWMSDIFCLEDSLKMINAVSAFCGVEEKGKGLTSDISESFEQLKALPKPISALYLIWKDPFMAAGQGTFINEMMNLGGFKNLTKGDRYPELGLEEIKAINPAVIMLSSEPYPFATKHQVALQKLLPKSMVMLVDGELFSWYGSRLLKLPGYLTELREVMKR